MLKCYPNTVESSLFVEDQCSWVTLAHEFMFPKNIYVKHLFDVLKIFPNLLPTKLCPQECFGYPQTLAPTNKYDLRVLPFWRSQYCDLIDFDHALLSGIHLR